MPVTVARMAAACELKSLTDSQEIAALAVKYQLMGRQTNYLAIDVKADGKKTVDFPELRKTPQMLAAGWGGTGMVVSVSELSESTAPYYRVSSDELNREPYNNFIDAMNRLHSRMLTSTLAISSIQDLEIHGVPEDVIEALIVLSESGIEDHLIVVTFLYHLSQQEQYKKAIHRSLRRIIIKAYKQLPEIKQEIAQKIEGIIVSNNI